MPRASPKTIKPQQTNLTSSSAQLGNLRQKKFNYSPANVITCLPWTPSHRETIMFQISSFSPRWTQVKGIVNSIPNNKAPGINKVPPRVLKENLPTIVPCITSIINASFESGVFSASWKTAEVFPILKNGDHEEANNYRPISLLPILSKICERVALNQLTSYLTTNQRISTKQSGNKRWHLILSIM